MDDYSCRRTGGVLGAARELPQLHWKNSIWILLDYKKQEKSREAGRPGRLAPRRTYHMMKCSQVKSVTWVMSSLFGVTKTPASRVGIDGYGWWWSRLLFNGILLGVAGYSWIGPKEKDCWVVVTGWLRRLRCLGKYCGGCVVYCQVNLEIQYCLRFSRVTSD